MKPPRRPACAEIPQFPKQVLNRPSLPHIQYRIGTYSDARARMFYELDRDVKLAEWTHRGADDPGIALVEGAAILADILTFYQELYANEAFLRTATWRESVADLVKLTGYRLTPAIGGRAQFSMQVRGNDPVQVPAGFAVKADLAHVPDTATFETEAAITAQPFLNSFHLFGPMDPQDCAPGVTALRAPGNVTLKSGDKLLVGDPSGGTEPLSVATSEIVVVDKVRQYHGETLFTIKGALRRHDFVDRSSTALTAYKLGRTFKHFGHNAPPQEINTKSDGSGVTAQNIEYWRPMHDVTDSTTPGNTTVVPTFTSTQIPLEVAVDDLAADSLVVLRAEWEFFGSVDGWTNVRRVVAAAKTGVRWGSLSGSATILSIDEELDAGPFITEYLITEIQIFEVLDDGFTIRAQALPTVTPRGRALYFLGTPAQAALLENVELAFVEPDAETYTRTVVAVAGAAGTDPTMIGLLLDDDVDYAGFDNEAPRVTVYGNLLLATEGKSHAQVVLGSGDARATFQTFRVPKAPLTYLVRAGATPPQEPEIHVYVGPREWKQVDALYGYGPADETYVVRQDAQGESWVQFGDGITGARVPSGVDNVTAVWRFGAGSYGPMKPKTDPSLGSRLDGLSGAKLPGLVTGGAPRESGDHAREVAPGRLQSLGRLVSIDDFASEALGIGGVVRARADWDLIGGVPGIVVTILMAVGRSGEADDVRATLAKYNRCRGPHRVPILVRMAAFEYVYLDAMVALDPRRLPTDVLPAIKVALGTRGEEANGIDGTGGLFDLAGRALGENEYTSRIEGVIQDVDGVVWTQVTAFGSLGTASDPATLPLPATPRPLVAKLVAAPDRMFCLFSRGASDPNANVLNLTVASSPPGVCDG